MSEKAKPAPGKAAAFPFMNPDLPVAERVADLLGRMTLREKASQMLHEAPAIERLGIPEYNWWNECLHGVGRAGVATVFPQAIGLAATWDDALMHRLACVISDEARAKHHEFARRGDRGIYKGLTFWSPNINIFRDPRWGRGQETYGEDPFLTARMGVAFVRGLQGDDPDHLKLVATPKHYAVHSGPETLRHEFDARVTERDLRETYLPAFKACVQEARAFSVMGAYNRTNGEVCCGSPTLLQKILRDEWGFEGYVVSDCGAVCDFHQFHKITDGPAESAAMAVKNGCDLNCGATYGALVEAVEKGLLSEEEIDRSVARLLMARFRLGMFDPPERVPYARIPYEKNDSPEHRSLAREVAAKSMVLLKNDKGLLPLDREKLSRVAVIGPAADDYDVLIGNYFGTPSKYVTLREGIRDALSETARLYYAEGCGFTGDSEAGFAEAVAAAEQSDLVVVCLGLSPRLEGEEGDVANSDGGGDRLHIDLPGRQEKLLQSIHATGKPIVLVVTGGSPIALNWAQQNVPAILFAWYPGEEGGNGLADILFGALSPGGRLPLTFPKSLEQLPPFTEYAMAGRTYRYMEEEPLYPFGYGLSFTSFEYTDLTLQAAGGLGELSGQVHLSVQVRNTGDYEGDEVVQVYATLRDAAEPKPSRSLVAFRRVHLGPGEEEKASFSIPAERLARIGDDGKPEPLIGALEFCVGGRQPDARSEALAGGKVLSGRLEVGA